MWISYRGTGSLSQMCLTLAFVAEHITSSYNIDKHKAETLTMNNMIEVLCKEDESGEGAQGQLNGKEVWLKGATVEQA